MYKGEKLKVKGEKFYGAVLLFFDFGTIVFQGSSDVEI
jgi:hypothetical protein